jgi:hypothetical protein
MAQAGDTKPPRVTWRARIRAAWKGLHLAERVVWIIAAALVVFGIEIGGLFTVVGGSDKPFAFVLNRFTGTVSLCVPGGCKDL